MTAPRVVCIGVATLDAIVAVDRLPGADERVPGTAGRLAGGGVAATAAVALARLGVPVAFIGRVGDDETGRWIRDDLAREGVDVEGLVLGPGTSPLSAVLVESQSGTRALAPYSGDTGAIDLSAADIERCAATSWIHLDHAGYGVLARLRAAGVTTRVSLDGGVEIDDLSLADVNLYAPTESALVARYRGGLEAALRWALDEGPALVVATRGAAGSVAIERTAAAGEAALHAAPGFAVPDADPSGSTLGAGDVFHGALLAALIDGHPVAESLRRANATAALSCRALDGRSAIPTRDELSAFLASAASPIPATGDPP
jgi:sulfofructose kinase